MSNLARETRLKPLMIAIGTEGEMKGKILGQVPWDVFIKKFHKYVEDLDAGLVTTFPPTPQYGDHFCRYEIMRPQAGWGQRPKW